MNLEKIKIDLQESLMKLIDQGRLVEGDDIVLGGSSSEVLGNRLGSNTNLDISKWIVGSLLEILEEKGIYLVVQACEHLNRALVVEREYAIKKNLDIVNVIPVKTAGGGFATAAMELFKDPVVVEKVRVKAGMDIGDVFIAMHIKEVGVVVRPSIDKIGQAHLTMIRSREKLIGGARAKYF